jgi:general secretion pathway protein I
MNRPPHSQSGFTLIEVLVALGILGISLAVLLQIFSQSLTRARESQNEMAASAIAQSLLADAGPSMPLVLGDTEGKTTDGFFWQLHVEPYGSDADRTAWPMDALSLSVTVGWNDAGKKRSMTLTTLRAVPKEQRQ